MDKELTETYHLYKKVSGTDIVIQHKTKIKSSLMDFRVNNLKEIECINRIQFVEYEEGRYRFYDWENDSNKEEFEEWKNKVIEFIKKQIT